MRFIQAHAQDIGARQSQQDCYGFGEPEERSFLDHGGFLSILADGMGGMEHGDAASRTAVRTFREAYAQKTPAESIPDALERSLRTTNAAVVAHAKELALAEKVGTTLVAAVIHESGLFWTSVGDSNLYLVRDGRMQLLTKAHVFANLLEKAVAAGSLTEKQAAEHPERESLTAYIGSAEIAEIDRNTDPVPLQAGDTVMLASDGLFKTLDDAEIARSFDARPEMWPSLLMSRVLAKKLEQQDNVTVVTVNVLDLDPEPAQLVQTSTFRVLNWVVRILIVAIILSVFALLYRTFTVASPTETPTATPGSEGGGSPR
jgi:PPM family protein phosphatase